MKKKIQIDIFIECKEEKNNNNEKEYKLKTKNISRRNVGVIIGNVWIEM